MSTTEKALSLSACLNARMEGSGVETIVFGHGYGTDQSIWDKILPLLAHNYRVVTFDWAFAGTVNDKNLYDPLKYSSLEGFADDLITLLNEMNLKHVTFVGHSMSGMIGCIASVKSPHLFNTLILVASSPRFLNSDDYEGGFSSSDIEQLLSNIETNYENFTCNFASLIADPINDLAVDKYEKCLKTMRPEVALSLAKTIFYSDWREMLEKVETPCIIIQTKKDAAVPHNVALYMENKIKGTVTLEIIDTIGHFPHPNPKQNMATTEKGLLASLNVRMEGSGPETLVFGHGFGTDQFIWDKILPLLAQNYRVVTFDWAFAGTVNDKNLYDPLKYSSLEGFADDLITLLNEMNLKHVTFVGHSMSGMIGCFASIKSPQLFKRLILVCSSPRCLNSDDYEGGFSSSATEELLSIIETNYENFASTFASLAADPINGLYADKFEKSIKEMRPEVTLSLAKTVFYSDHREILDKVEIPCTIIQTNKDVAVPHSVALYMENKIKRATLEIIDTVGHFPQLTAHLKFVQVLRGALGS
ncbi:putative strigolactone esterase DAD2, partial [Mucuna pruriens]